MYPSLNTERKVTLQQLFSTASALFNGIALLGWNPPHREDASLVFNESTGVFMRQEVLTLEDMIN